MKTLNNELIIQRGESFTIDKYIENKDGSPYIISSRLSNPYWLLTVSDSKYEQNNRYVKNYWLNLSNFPRFLSTQAVDLRSIKVSATSDVNKYDAFPDDGVLEGYVNGAYVKYETGDAVFYLENDGQIEYKYFNTLLDSTKTPIGWTNYKCRLVKAFTTKDTAELVDQTYVYSIRLVSGPSTRERVESLCHQYGIEFDPLDGIDILYNLLPEHVKAEININRPITIFDSTIDILTPTKLTVLSDIQGDV